MSKKSHIITDERDSTGCAYCVRYLNHIEKLQALLDDSGIDYKPLKSIRKDKDKVVPDTMDRLDLSDDRIENLVNEYYTEEIFLQGHKGVIDFIHSYVVRDDDSSELVYVCADATKKVFHYYNDDGLQKDIRCKALIDAIYDPLIKKVNKIYRVIINRIYEEDDVLVVRNESSSDDEEDDGDSDIEYDEDIDEVIAEELHKESKGSDASNSSKSVDEKVNESVSVFLEIKKSIGKVRKPIVDELVSLLTL